MEHTSANPTGPFHIGRVRNAIIGDTLARIVRASGTPVTTQYYVDDMGRQAAMITWIWSKPLDEWPEPIRAIDGEEVAGEKPDAHRGRPVSGGQRVPRSSTPRRRREVAELVRHWRAESRHRSIAS